METKNILIFFCDLFFSFILIYLFCDFKYFIFIYAFGDPSVRGDSEFVSCFSFNKRKIK